MKKIIASTFALTMLSSSAAFADATKLSAFEGIDTSAASVAELHQVSGEGALQNLVLATGLVDILPNINLALAIDGQTLLAINSGALVLEVVGTADQLVGEVVTTVDGVVTTAVNLVQSLDPSVNVDVSIAGININTSTGLGL